ncbi:hypothetical protein PSH28_02880, partial [Pseudomonas resinovorans]|uniref:hypothetical protein n=1 Tax=Metapseudomonas resinovorans TaxID=53412 RepID=UPI00237FAA54
APLGKREPSIRKRTVQMKVGFVERLPSTCLRYWAKLMPVLKSFSTTSVDSPIWPVSMLYTGMNVRRSILYQRWLGTDGWNALHDIQLVGQLAVGDEVASAALPAAD